MYLLHDDFQTYPDERKIVLPKTNTSSSNILFIHIPCLSGGKVQNSNKRSCRMTISGGRSSHITYAYLCLLLFICSRQKLSLIFIQIHLECNRNTNANSLLAHLFIGIFWPYAASENFRTIDKFLTWVIMITHSINFFLWNIEWEISTYSRWFVYYTFAHAISVCIHMHYQLNSLIR